MYRTWQKIDESEFLQLHASGYTDRQLAEHFDTAKRTVSEYRKQRNLPYNGKGKAWERGTPKVKPESKPTMSRASRVALLEEIKERASKRTGVRV
jgi:hypothetical protein